MAGDWLKWTKGLARKPEVFALSAALGLSRREVAATLMEVWEWADDCVTRMSRAERDEVATSDDGFVRLHGASGVIDDLVAVPGFAAAMASVGWLKVRTDAIEFPKFGRHNGKHARDRVLAAERKRSQRQETVPEVSRSHRDKSVTREEKRREEKREEEPPNPPSGGGSAKPPKAKFEPEKAGLPSYLDTPVFRAAWSRWCAHRREKGAALKLTTVAAQLTKMAEWGEARAVAAIDHTIFKGWTGLREPDTRPGGVPGALFGGVREWLEGGGDGHGDAV